MKIALNRFWKSFFNSLFIPEVSYSRDEYRKAKMEKNVEKAKQEWNDAHNYFNEVTDPDLVEYATYLIETTRRKYIYLVKKVKDSPSEF